MPYSKTKMWSIRCIWYVIFIRTASCNRGFVIKSINEQMIYWHYAYSALIAFYSRSYTCILSLNDISKRNEVKTVRLIYCSVFCSNWQFLLIISKKSNKNMVGIVFLFCHHFSHDNDRRYFHNEQYLWMVIWLLLYFYYTIFYRLILGSSTYCGLKHTWE